MKQSVDVYIDELVLHGFSPSDKYRIGEAVQAELQRLFAEGGAPGGLLNGGSNPSIDAGSFRYSGNRNAVVVGKQIAHSIFASLSPSPGIKQ